MYVLVTINSIVKKKNISKLCYDCGNSMIMIIRLGLFVRWTPKTYEVLHADSWMEEIHVGPHSKRPRTIIEFPSTHMDMGQHNFVECSRKMIKIFPLPQFEGQRMNKKVGPISQTVWLRAHRSLLVQ